MAKLAPEDTAALLQVRKKMVAADIEKREQAVHRHTVALAELRKELSEIEIAESVLAKIGAGAEGYPTREPREPADAQIQKPDNAPPMPEMIKEALADIHRRGITGVEPALGILPYIQQRWWPQATAISVGPIAWRMWKRGELRKQGPRYSLPNAADYFPADMAKEDRELFE
jgi:hypothetical protein